MGLIIEPSQSAWCSPSVSVVKPDRLVRLCVDYYRLQATPQLQQVILTLDDDVLERAGKARVMSKLDLTNGYYQIRMAEQFKNLTTFVSPWGCFRFTQMPFGLRNARALFQSLMERVLVSCRDFASVYIDDVLIYLATWQEHLQHTARVLTALQAGLTAKPTQCQWGRQHLDHLGHTMGCGKVAVLTHRVEAIASFKRPRMKKELHAFLDSVGYYRRFVMAFANSSALLTLTALNVASGKVERTEEMLRAFQNLRESCVTNAF